MKPIENIWFINGEQAEAMPLDDRGLAYGDGLFETMRAIGSNIPLRTLHERRLLAGCKRLGMALESAELERWLDDVLQQLTSDQSVIKIIVTRSGPSTGYASSEKIDQAHIYIRVSPLVDAGLHNQTVNARVCNLRLSSQSALAGIKHLNRLEQVLAAKEIGNPKMEGILMDSEGYVIEAISSNLIAVDYETLYIPDLGYSGVQGVMQAYIEDLASREGYRIKTARMKLQEFIQMPEILVCNAIRGVRNIDSIEHHWKSTSKKTGSYLRAQLLEELNDQFYSY